MRKPKNAGSAYRLVVELRGSGTREYSFDLLAPCAECFRDAQSHPFEFRGARILERNDDGSYSELDSWRFE